jgi:hypothetical protein
MLFQNEISFIHEILIRVFLSIKIHLDFMNAQIHGTSLVNSNIIHEWMDKPSFIKFHGWVDGLPWMNFHVISGWNKSYLRNII